MSDCIIKSVSLHGVVLLKAFGEMIKGPALIAHLEKLCWKSERGREFGKF